MGTRQGAGLLYWGIAIASLASLAGTTATGAPPPAWFLVLVQEPSGVKAREYVMLGHVAHLRRQRHLLDYGYLDRENQIGDVLVSPDGAWTAAVVKGPGGDRLLVIDMKSLAVVDVVRHLTTYPGEFRWADARTLERHTGYPRLFDVRPSGEFIQETTRFTPPGWSRAPQRTIRPDRGSASAPAPARLVRAAAVVQRAQIRPPIADRDAWGNHEWTRALSGQHGCVAEDESAIAARSYRSGRDELVLLRASRRWKVESVPSPRHVWMVGFWRQWLVVGEAVPAETVLNRYNRWPFARRMLHFYDMVSDTMVFPLRGEAFVPLPESAAAPRPVRKRERTARGPDPLGSVRARPGGPSTSLTQADGALCYRAAFSGYAKRAAR